LQTLFLLGMCRVWRNMICSAHFNSPHMGWSTSFIVYKPIPYIACFVSLPYTFTKEMMNMLSSHCLLSKNKDTHSLSPHKDLFTSFPVCRVCHNIIRFAGFNAQLQQSSYGLVYQFYCVSPIERIDQDIVLAWSVV
jgi:hypothetical protein